MSNITELRIYLQNGSLFTYIVGKPCPHHDNQVVSAITYCLQTSDEPALYMVEFDGNRAFVHWQINNIAGASITRHPPAPQGAV